MRAAIASVLVLALGVLISAVLLINCPFISTSASHSAPSCPRESQAPSKCPLAPTLETCPYFITEAKLGYADEKVLKTPSFLVTEIQTVTISETITRKPATKWTPAGTDLHLRIRVLLI